MHVWIPRKHPNEGRTTVADIQFCSLHRLSQEFCLLKIMFLLHDTCKSGAEAYLECRVWEVLSVLVCCVIGVQKGKVHWSLRFYNTHYHKKQITFTLL